MPEYKTDHIQATTINMPATGIAISAVYCPPRHNINKEQFTNYFKTLGSKFVSAGDFNAKHTYWGSRLITPRGRQLLETVMSNNLDAVSSGHPTYWPTDLNKIPDVIDFAVIKNVKREHIELIPSLDLSSDHSPTLITLSDYQQNIDRNYIYFPNRQTNWLKYRKYVSAHLPQNIPLRTEDEIQSAVNQVTNILTDAAELATPTTTSLTTKRVINTARHIQCLVREKRRLRRQWQEFRSPMLKTQLRLCQKMLREALQKEKEFNLNKFLQNLDATEKTDYSLWKAVRKMKGPTVYEAPIRLQNGEWAKNSHDKAEEFAKYLETVFVPNDTNSCLTPVVVQENFSNPLKVRLPVLKAVIKNLNPKKSPGRDKITNTMIVNLPSVALKTILFIFNSMLRTGYFPSTWKQSEIVMISKPGKDVTQVTSYRPISLLPVLSKIFEKIVLKSLTPHIATTNLIPNHQFWFREKHSTIEQVHRITNLIRETFESKRYCSALFIDISQAFDKVWHEGLLYKISTLLPENVHKLFTSYLSNRSFVVRSKSTFSSVKRISAGVPQDSILGPFLYLLYTADLPTNLLTHTSTFAWEYILGIHLDRRLTWTHHIAAKITQLKIRTSQLYWLMGSHSSLSLDHKVLLYKAALKPIWLYGIQLWGSASASNVEKLQRRQSKILRLITCAPWYIRNNNIHKDLNITTIREEIKKSCTSYTAKVTDHPNPFARDLLLFEGHRRLKRVHTFDLTR
ncbi:Probable RNA-directed DNA polymerase from transposon X-element [Eumeta japonica]|uniref:Probable RNA-directed DNA polymerase from transposon X-element n=1 Tax=Eumeta variegata TaxID=151549 RepID=A0A4C1SFE3_EUMVA|nr:Probable RNA-directed DNA polymerase from transposon X-element [Eumeta japonica]